MVDKESILKVMNEADAVYLATVSGASPRIRAMVNLRRRDLYPGAADFCQKKEFTSYFATSIASGKVREIRANSAVSVYYCDPKEVRGVMLSGHMEILTGSDLKKALWQDQWLIYWPAGADDPDYAVLRLEPTRATGWWGAAPFYFEVSRL